MTSKMLVRALTAVGLIGLLSTAAAAPGESEWRQPWGLNLPEGVTSLSRQAYDLHMVVFYIVCVIAAIVFIGIFYSMWRFRKSAGARPAHFHHNTTVEVIWTVIPFLILLGISIPATQTMIEMEDTSDYDMTVKVTGYQWMWEYEYLDEDISFFSGMDPGSQQARQRDPETSPSEVEHYLLDVDNPLVLPIDKRIRFLLTSNDVIHSWWVPQLGWKKDTIPGFVNEAWARIEEPGVYRGQCAELCGRDHAFMPVVVIALEQDEYEDWVAEQNGEAAAAGDEPAEGDVDDVAEEDLEDMSEENLMTLGGQVYNSQCLACHRAEGEGMGGFPALDGSEKVTGDVSAVNDVVINGVSGTAMQAFGDRLDDREVAAVVTYIRNSWGNDTGDLVQPSEVRDTR